MLFDRTSVKTKVPLEGVGSIIRSSPYVGKKDLKKFLRGELSRKETDFDTVLNTINWISQYVGYDATHEFIGFRTPPEVMIDQKGHCLEQNVLLINALDSLGVKTKPILIKNPRSFIGEKYELAVHLLLRFRQGNTTYLADQTSDGIYLFDKSFQYTAIQGLSRRELTALCFADAAEDFAFHERPSTGMQYIRAAITMDPNNYTFYLTAGEIRMQQEKPKRAEWNFKHAIKMAPDLADPYKIFADSLFMNKRRKESKEYYRKAALRGSKDMQLLQTLLPRLRYFQMTEEEDRVKERIEDSERRRDFSNDPVTLYRLNKNGKIRISYHK